MAFKYTNPPISFPSNSIVQYRTIWTLYGTQPNRTVQRLSTWCQRTQLRRRCQGFFSHVAPSRIDVSLCLKKTRPSFFLRIDVLLPLKKKAPIFWSFWINISLCKKISRLSKSPFPSISRVISLRRCRFRPPYLYSTARSSLQIGSFWIVGTYIWRPPWFP